VVPSMDELFFHSYPKHVFLLADVRYAADFTINRVSLILEL